MKFTRSKILEMRVQALIPGGCHTYAKPAEQCVGPAIRDHRDRMAAGLGAHDPVFRNPAWLALHNPLAARARLVMEREEAMT